MEYPQRTKKIKMSGKELLNNEISVVLHDGVVSASQKRILEIDFEKAIISGAKIMESIAAEIENEGAVIGHLKAFVKSNGANGRISLTNKKADVAYKGISSHNKCEIDFNMIVLNTDEETVKKYVKMYFNKIMEGYVN